MNQDTKKHILLYALIIVLAVMLIVAFAKIEELNDEIFHLTNTYNNRINSMNYEIAAIYDNVEEQLKKQASLFSSVEFSYGDFDPENATAEVNITVVPKALTEDTHISVSLGDHTSNLSREENCFSTTISVGLFETHDVYPLATVTSGGESKTELLDSVYITYLWSEFLPTVNASIEASEKLSNGQVKIDGTLFVNCDQKYDGVWLEKVSLVTEINGNEIAREDVTDRIKFDAQSKIADSSLEAPFSKTYPYTEGEMLSVYIVAEDSAGFVHKTLAYSFYLLDGAQAEQVVTVMGEAIYDKEGNALYGGKFEIN